MSTNFNVKNINSPSFASITRVTGTEKKVDEYIETNAPDPSVSGHNNGNGIILDGEHVADFFEVKCGIKIPEGLRNAKDKTQAQVFAAQNPDVVMKFAKQLNEAMSDFTKYTQMLFGYVAKKESEGVKVNQIDL